MNTQRNRNESGQSLVIIALGIVAFVAILALVVDGANAYAAKRQAQNAADAGALAGATYMCKNHDQAGGIAQAQDYAVNKNGAANADVTASLSAGTVVVTATVDRPTFFAGALGFLNVTPRAIAAAECRPPVGVGVLPVAWACRSTVVGGMNVPGEDCAQVTIDNCGGEPYQGVSDLPCTYILMDSVKVNDNKKGGHCDPTITDPSNPNYCYAQNDLVCSVHGPTLVPPQGCDYVAPNTTDCDLNNDCIDELMTGGARSWLDLNGAGGGASELSNWIVNGFPDPIPPHKWIPEESGVSVSIFHTAAAGVVGKNVVLPVFNNLCDGYPNIFVDPELGAQCSYGPYDDRSIAGPNMNFHIITFSEFHVTCVETGQNHVDAENIAIDTVNGLGKECIGHHAAATNEYACDPNPPHKCQTSIDSNDKTIEGYFKVNDLGGYGGPGPWFNAGTFTVVLTK